MINTAQFKTALLIAVMLVCAAGIVWAQKAHFTKVTAILEGDKVTVSWKEAGLGNNQGIDYVVSADAVAIFNCVDDKGQCPAPANKVTVSKPVTGKFSSDKNGSITANLTLLPPDAGSFVCPSGHKLILSEISYSNIKVTDATNKISQVANPGTLSAKLFVCPVK